MNYDYTQHLIDNADKLDNNVNNNVDNTVDKPD